MKRTDVCLDCPVSLVCIGGAMDVGEIYVCGVCGGADFVANTRELQRLWLKNSAEGIADPTIGQQGTIHIENCCPRIIRKDGKLVGVERGKDEEGDMRVVRPVIYACVACFQKKFKGGRADLEYEAIYYWIHGRARSGSHE
jgi:hypothetical protein